MLRLDGNFVLRTYCLQICFMVWRLTRTVYYLHSCFHRRISEIGSVGNSCYVCASLQM